MQGINIKGIIEGGGVIVCGAALQPFSLQQNVFDCQTSVRVINIYCYIFIHILDYDMPYVIQKKI